MYEEFSAQYTRAGVLSRLAFPVASSLCRLGRARQQFFMTCPGQIPALCRPCPAPPSFCYKATSPADSKAHGGAGSVFAGEGGTAQPGRSPSTSAQDLAACGGCCLDFWSLCPAQRPQQGGQRRLTSSWQLGSSLEGGRDTFPKWSAHRRHFF